MARYDTAQFIRNVIRDAKIPAGSSYRSASTLLGLASDEMEQLVVPELIKVTGGHLMAYTDVALVAGKTRYRFPARCLRPERLQIVNSDGKLLGKLHLVHGDMVDEVLAGRCPQGDAMGYWVAENSHAVIVLQRQETSSSERKLRTYFRRQPNQLVEVGGAEAGVVSAVAGGGALLTLDFSSEANATAFSAAVDGLGGTSALDFIAGSPGFEAYSEDVVLAGAGGAVDPDQVSITVNLTNHPGVIEAAVGDVVALAGYTCIPQLPVAMHGVLVAYTVAAVHREMGNLPAAQAAFENANRKLATALTTITPRGDESETTVDDVWLSYG